MDMLYLHFSVRLDFNSTYNGADEGLTCDCLLRHHPGVTLSDFWLVENENTGEVISTTCLIPWTCRYGEIELRTAMLEMVLTHPDYRGQGLVRIQVKHFLQEVQARGFDLSIIWGIPYYYRQYGYGYALDGDMYESLPVWRIPDDPPGKSSPYRLQPATVEDINCLTDLYPKAVAPLQLCVLRDAPYWEYLLRWADFPVEMLDNEPRRHIHRGE
jgi:predicted acetyltransferase